MDEVRSLIIASGGSCPILLKKLFKFDNTKRKSQMNQSSHMTCSDIYLAQAVEGNYLNGDFMIYAERLIALA